MAYIPSWNGTSQFIPGTGQTPFGYYDNDAHFAADIDRFCRHAAFKLGWPTMNVELQAEHFYAAFEGAVMEYANEVYKFKIQDNYLNYEGTANPAGSAFNGRLTVPSLGSIIRIAKTYGSEAGSGGLVPYYSGSVDVKAGQQNYDLNLWGQISGSIGLHDSLEIKKVFHEAPPASVRWIDPFYSGQAASAYTVDQMGWGAMGQSVNYMMMPVSYDVARFQAIEFNDEIRRSAYSFQITNNQLKLFPIPQFDTKVWFQYIKTSERDRSTLGLVDPDNPVVSDPSNVPFTQITYGTINSVGKTWIVKFAVALSKSILAMIRGKYVTLPTAGSNMALNYQSLESQAIDEQDKLLTEIRELLTKTSRSSQLEKQLLESEQIKGTLANIPMLIYVG